MPLISMESVSDNQLYQNVIQLGTARPDNIYNDLPVPNANIEFILKHGTAFPITNIIKKKSSLKKKLCLKTFFQKCLSCVKDDVSSDNDSCDRRPTKWMHLQETCQSQSASSLNQPAIPKNGKIVSSVLNQLAKNPGVYLDPPLIHILEPFNKLDNPQCKPLNNDQALELGLHLENHEDETFAKKLNLNRDTLTCDILPAAHDNIQVSAEFVQSEVDSGTICDIEQERNSGLDRGAACSHAEITFMSCLPSKQQNGALVASVSEGADGTINQEKHIDEHIVKELDWIVFPKNSLTSKSKQHENKTIDDLQSVLNQIVFLGKTVHPRNCCVITGMLQEDYYCYPRYSLESSRLDTLRACDDRHLKNFQRDDLAQAGWYHNGRTLVTFCCGMEMPSAPRGQPLTVHRGLSPQCSFAHSVVTQSSIICDSVAETEQENPVIGYGFQPTQDPDGSEALSAELVTGGVYHQPGLRTVIQETVPSEHWIGETLPRMLGYPTQAEDHATQHCLVTNTALLPSETWQPNIVSQEPVRDGQSHLIPQNAVSRVARYHGRISSIPTRMSRSMRNLDLATDGFEFHEHDGFFGDGERPRHPQFMFPNIRLRTFEGWPPGHAQTPYSLAEAGLFFAGYGDCCYCYFCGIGLRHWTQMDDPWIEHARWRPSCYYVLAHQGQHFIDAALEMTRNDRHPTFMEVQEEAERKREAALAEAASEQLAAASLDDAGEGSSQLCAVCHVQERNAVLMPCRHLAVCHRCRNFCRTCPICHAAVDTSFIAIRS